MCRVGYVPSWLCAEFAVCRLDPTPYNPVKTVKVIFSWSVYLTTVLLSGLSMSFKLLNSTCEYSLPETEKCSS